ncbi:hypothetical protein PUR57_06015 [Streptomyces sp. JV176]|uniref:DUF6879 family protein n=1 Tax=Streptomyces sp. JV176 TaxID=858630 RepID=UPI002E7631EC|nr:DUF6879 family protein [Streptomyces sp. JV176]MEE1798233.1 hypothetical protein [Streptomyces sp. JV176]
MAGLVTGEQRDKLFHTFQQEAFHLELKDAYRTTVEDGPYAKWQRGEDDDYAWFTPWLDQTRALTATGKKIRRVRVVSEPFTDYIRWEHSLTPLNLEAGEDIRWLPRRLLHGPVTFPVNGNDWWLFDREVLAVTHFREDGRYEGSELIEDPKIVGDCVRLRDQLWGLALPYDQYQSD